MINLPPEIRLKAIEISKRAARRGLRRRQSDSYCHCQGRRATRTVKMSGPAGWARSKHAGVEGARPSTARELFRPFQGSVRGCRRL